MHQSLLSMYLTGTLLFMAPMTAAAQDLDLFWHTIDGGGDMWTIGGDFELSGTIGQPDAGAAMTGGSFELAGGFWVETIVTTPCPGDLDGDGDVDLADLAALLASYGACEGDPGFNPAADLDDSGCVDLSDLATLLSHYGEGP